MPRTLPAEASRAIRTYLRAADRILPGGIIACAVSGSIALGAYRPGRSDIDLVAVIAEEWRHRRDLIARLRLLHLSQLPRLALRAATGRGVSACCNTSFIWEDQASEPVTMIVPIASHVGEIFESGAAFDVNPVVWKELVDDGITVRGRDLSNWDLDPEPERLTPWVRANLREYWAPLAEQLRTAPSSAGRLTSRFVSRLPGRLPGQLPDGLFNRPRQLSASKVEWCLLGPARMHHTLMTGEIIGKEEAGRRALDTFPQHSPITEVALAQVRGARIPATPRREEWRGLTASAMEDIIAEALRTAEA